MVSQHQAPDEDGGGGAFILGIYFALLLAIPLWAGIGIAAVLRFQEGPFIKRLPWRRLQPQRPSFCATRGAPGART
jgi:hypothetical protein